jgi:hypothetical protein
VKERRNTETEDRMRYRKEKEIKMGETRGRKGKNEEKETRKVRDRERNTINVGAQCSCRFRPESGCEQCKACCSVWLSTPVYYHEQEHAAEYMNIKQCLVVKWATRNTHSHDGALAL